MTATVPIVKCQRVVIEFDGPYNTRRYSKPWIARVVDWKVGLSAELEFGKYLGNGDGGEREIMACAGDVVRWGIKDYRGNGTRAYWGIVQEDGSVTQCTAAQARKAYQEK
jgi:hypothetical protein